MKSLAKALLAAVLPLALASCATPLRPVPLGTGDWVLARWQTDDPYWYPAIVTTRSGEDISLQYDDGDTGVQSARNVRRFDWAAGEHVDCKYTDGNWYRAVITEMGANRVDMRIRYEDNERQATDTSQCRER